MLTKNITRGILVLFFFTASTSSCNPIQSTLTRTPLPSATAESTSTPTLIPTSSATPQPKSNGTLLMKIDLSLLLQDIKPQEKTTWYSSSSDGSNLQPLEWNIWSLSPDGKRALTYSNENIVSITNLQDMTSIQLDDSLNYCINCSFQTAIWLSDGRILIAASPKEQPAKMNIYFVSQDGSLTKWKEISQLTKKYAELLFITPDNKQLFWRNHGENGYEYYISSLDDSGSISFSPKGTRYQDVHISPSGRYVSYVGFTGTNTMACFLYDLSDGSSTKMVLADGSPISMEYCFGNNHWSPTEDKLFGVFSTLSIPDYTITSYPHLEYETCYSINWTPDGKYLFHTNCTTHGSSGSSGLKKNVNYFSDTIDSKLIDIDDGSITEFQNVGFCDPVVSPDSKWVLLYNCTDGKNLVVPTSLLINLETKSMTPLFMDIFSRNKDDLLLPGQSPPTLWTVFWVP